ncbi:protein phosphatase 1H [Culicoides brevitarsis]|uniref:protein phosphatase 1H n=1 Tax=Culicoides brevitarsis TaxID=469753 RepID=UPI00307BCF88
MLNRMKNRVLDLIVAPDLPALPSSSATSTSSSSSSSSSPYANNKNLPDKFIYSRPGFLNLSTTDELKASADHNLRPIIVPRDLNAMPWYSGYAECINSGKSQYNEDQAAFSKQTLSHPSKQYPDLPYMYFGIFDGHASHGCSLAASLQFHHILHEKLVDIIELLLPKKEVAPASTIPTPLFFVKNISKDELIVGALESAFHEMDSVIDSDRDKYRNAGGCTACVALFILGKMYIANAGDSRAILCQKLPQDIFRAEIDPKHQQNGNSTKNSEETEYHVFSTALSWDHTPDTERPRLLSTAQINPTLMGDSYCPMEFAKKPLSRDLGQRVMYRSGTMRGWAFKTLTRDDLKSPTLVTGEGKRSRLMGTIGVTRGFGDHDLRALYSGMLIKPFLSAQPDVNFRDLTKVISIPGDGNEDGEYGVLVMATDGLWDVTEINDVAHTVFKTLKKYPTERHRYTMAAQELVAKARGRINESGHWRLSDSKAAATVDDISVFVIPVYQYYKEFVEWEKLCNSETNSMNVSSDEPDIDKLTLSDTEVIEAKEELSTEAPETEKNDAATTNDDNFDTRENEDM